MSRPIVRVLDVDGSVAEEREMNDAEFEQWQADKAIMDANEQARIQAEQAKAALLAKLGITEEEAKLLLG